MKVLRILRLAPAIAKIVFIDYGNVSEKVSTDTDVRRGTSRTSRDAPIFVHFLKKNQNSYTLVVKKTKFVHFGGKKTKIRIL